MRMVYIFVFTLFSLSIGSPAHAGMKQFSGWNFSVDVLSRGRILPLQYDSEQNNYFGLRVMPGDSYEVRVYNPLPVRVGVEVSVDGLNTIDGKNHRPGRGAKWVIQPYSFITVRGWQTGQAMRRSFVFDYPSRSYASWREQDEGVAHTLNHGIISVAYFWDSNELSRANQAYLSESDTDYPYAGDARKTWRHKKNDHVLSGRAPSQQYEGRREAGTRMGRREHSPVYAVDFDFDCGMYSLDDTLRIRYFFGEARVVPKEPYRYRQLQYAPEMPW